eukprot:3591376-Lingulodinium_polyedra.AAC.1
MESLKKWSQGQMHATELQRTCHNAYQDQIKLLNKVDISTSHVDKGLETMANVGNWGQNKGSIRRDLLNTL